jgi:hypothetical protein
MAIRLNQQTREQILSKLLKHAFGEEQVELDKELDQLAEDV